MSPPPEPAAAAAPAPLPALTLSQVRDVLEDLRRADLTVEPRRALVDQLSAYLSTRESQHALQQLLEQVNAGLGASDDVAAELGRWRPMVERALLAESARVEAEARRVVGEQELRQGYIQMVRQAITPQTVLLVLVIAAAAAGIRLSLPGVIEVGAP